MGGLLDALTGGANALQAQQLGAQVTGANVANANAPGYHRVDPIMNSGGALGTGAQTVIAQRSGLSFLDANVDAQSASLSYNQSRALSLGALQQSVGNLGDAGLGAALSNFFSAWRALSVNPQDVGVRIDTLSRIEQLASTVQGAAHSVAQQQSQIDAQVVASVAAINQQISAVAAYNEAIVAQAAGGIPPNDLMDRRDAAIAILASTLGATATTDASGQMSVLIGGGVSIVSGATANLLHTSVDATTGFHHVEVQGSTTGPLDSRITTGTVGALIVSRDQDLAHVATSLDVFAFDLTQAVNAVHQTNYGLDGTSGRPLFAAHAQAGAAAALSLDASVHNDPSALATSATAGGVPGDAAGAAQMVGLQDSTVASGNTTTLLGAVNAIVETIGIDTAQAIQAVSTGTVSLQYAQALAETQRGVSVEDQMMQLSHFQAAFQAATRFVHVIDEMLASLQAM